MKRKVILYIATSLDGFIAGPDEDLGFLDSMGVPGEDYGYSEFIKSVDTVILGRKTYDWVMRRVDVFPHNEMDTYVITRQHKKSEGKIKFFSGDLRDLIFTLKSKPGKNIFCDGGAEIVNLLIKENLIDEFIVSVVPVLLGKGIRLFKDDNEQLNLKLISSNVYKTGLIQLHYTKNVSPENT